MVSDDNETNSKKRTRLFAPRSARKRADAPLEAPAPDEAALTEAEAPGRGITDCP